MDLDLSTLKTLYANDMATTQSTYTHWYGYNQRFKNYLFIASIITGVGTLLTAATLEGTALKFWAAVFGALSTVAAALQRFSRVGAKAEFYGGQVKEVHVLWLKVPFVKTEKELREVVQQYAVILLAEGKLSRDGDDNRTLSEEIAKLRGKLEPDE